MNKINFGPLKSFLKAIAKKKATSNISFLGIVLATLTCSIYVSAKDLYIWKDNNGVQHFSDTLPAGVRNADKRDLKDSISDPSATNRHQSKPLQHPKSPDIATSTDKTSLTQYRRKQIKALEKEQLKLEKKVLRLQEQTETYHIHLERGGSYSSLSAKFSREGRYRNKIKAASEEMSTLQERIDEIDIQIDEIQVKAP